MRTFKEVVKGIKHAEKDVDKVLRAAKLQRNPEPRFDSIDILAFMIVGGMFICFIVAMILTA